LNGKIIVMDNHAAHKSIEVTKYIEKHKGVTLFMPPISSYFNPIETIWSWVKAKWRNILMQNEGM
jgi:transposase